MTKHKVFIPSVDMTIEIDDTEAQDKNQFNVSKSIEHIRRILSEHKIRYIKNITLR